MFASKDVSIGQRAAYPVARSVRLRSSASAYLNRTMSASFTSKRIFTFSFWCKRSTLSTAQSIFDRNQATNVNQFAVGFNSNDTFEIAARTSGTSTVSLQLTTSAVFRDVSAWYHIVIAVDNTQATLANRGAIYVNGVLQSLGTQTATQNVDYHLLTGLTYDIGRTALTASQYFDGYLTEFNFIDGQQLTPSSFGAFNVYGVWQPAKYQGTYGTNGFYLKFNSYATAAALGTDSSGNSNTWTVNNISVTAGATYDAMQDTPTLTSLSAANYAVLNPLANNAGGAGTVSNGNMALSVSSSQMTYLRPLTIATSSGQWYLEAIVNSDNTQQYSQFGIIQESQVSSSGALNTLSTSYGLTVTPSYVNYATFQGSTITQYGTRVTGAVTAQIAFDATNGKIWIGVNNTWLGGGNPSTGTTPTYSGIAAANWYFAMFIGNTSGANNCSVNLGQQPWSYTPPTGFNALNTFSLANPAIPNGATQFAATLYTGTGATQSIANTVNNVSFQPDLVWVKKRSGADNHELTNSVVGNNLRLAANTTDAQSAGGISVASSGFSLSGSPLYGTDNENGFTYVAWQWKASNSLSINTSGSITSTVNASTSSGFSIVTYTGTGAAATVGHGLSATPSMIIVKKRSGAGTTWAVYNVNIGAANSISLNSTAGSSAQNYWNSTTPTSSVWSMTGNAEVNGSGETYVAYVFTPVAGYSAFGSYAGNSSTDGPFIYLGFKPRWVMIKNITTIGNWLIVDTSRQNYNVAGPYLNPNLSDAETTGTVVFDMLSNGFKCRSSTTANSSGSTYIYMCFAENPFKYALAR